MPGRIAARLDTLGLTLHGPHPPHDPLDAVVVHDNVARTSGQLPRIKGQLTCTGTLGADVSVEEGAEAAEVCALNALAVLAEELGTLDRVERVLTVTGYVASTPDFHEQPAVVDGASRVLHAIFGDAGRHTRSAIGVAALPRGGPVEIEVTRGRAAGIGLDGGVGRPDTRSEAGAFATELEAANDDAIAFVEACTDEQWRTVVSGEEGPSAWSCITSPGATSR